MLRAMHRLRDITVLNARYESGIPWSILQAILSTPQLQSFVVEGRLYQAYDRLSETDVVFAAIETFRYRAAAYSTHARNRTEEKKMLSMILSKLAPSLVTLALPSECVPFSTMRQLYWPNLREVCTAGYGRRFSIPDTDVVSILGHAPRLRALTLDLATGERHELQALWPAHTQLDGIPWPELECLTVTWLHPEDTIFDRLPSTCRHLSFRTLPRPYNLYRVRLLKSVPWRIHMFSPSMILQTLQKCCDLPLEYLELEYRAETDDSRLLSFVASTFPRLQILRLIRYRSKDDRERVPVKNIMNHFSSMPNLRALELYLDLEHMTLPEKNRPTYEEFCRDLDAATSDMLPLLSPSVTTLFHNRR